MIDERRNRARRGLPEPIDGVITVTEDTCLDDVAEINGRLVIENGAMIFCGDGHGVVLANRVDLAKLPERPKLPDMKRLLSGVEGSRWVLIDDHVGSAGYRPRRRYQPIAYPSADIAKNRAHSKRRRKIAKKSKRANRCKR